MTRRDRTTGIPRHRPRESSTRERRFAGINWTDSRLRLAILGSAGLLLILVLGMIAYRWYDENVLMPRSTVLRVYDEKFSLQYFTDRLVPFAQENTSLSRGFLEPALMTKLEEEALTVRMAEDRGYDLSEDAVTQFIADEFGVAPGGQGTAYDTLYRQRLRETGLSDSNYRRLSKAALAESLLLDDVIAEIGDTGEALDLRVIVLDSEAEATEVLGRIEDGEDMGTIAQTDSSDIETRQQDGMLPTTPRELLPENVRAAIEDASEGDLVGPVEVQDKWWVFRVETITPDSTYTDGQKNQLAEMALAELISEAKAAAGSEIERSLSDSDIDWAYRNLDVPDVAGVN